MSIDQFYSIGFHSKMKILYDCKIYTIVGVDFDDKMVCIFENDERGNPIRDLLIWIDHSECDVC